MLRFIINVVSNGVLAALALLIAAWVVPGVGLQAQGFVVAVIIFALCQSLLAPIVVNFARKYASAVLGGIGLITSFLALFIATLLPGGLTITGASAWVLAPVVVWLVTALGGWLIIGLLINRRLDRRDADKRLAGAVARTRD